MNTADAAAVRARVAAATPPVECYDAEPTTPPNQYVVLYDQPPVAPLTRLAAVPVDDTVTFRLVVIARTTDGLRAAVAGVRAQLVGWRVQDTRDHSPLAQIDAGGVLPTGESGDRRYSQTLVFRYTRPFGGN